MRLRESAVFFGYDAFLPYRFFLHRSRVVGKFAALFNN
ncbi:hypothetical Protein YC6258_05077 [Gynuella sunshinyii YC6258]|uniref:Uncharacterized protein n=1 Tax=Gynuella sunshinyii YC6258 TaxID=1445510 RepID=A0A0C5VR44_9GAMM|nr:hypothetical Protein YC6258_05077 [Gynuella sunshinyii YC6258]